ncbi:MAG: FAD:protein FMN transferase [Solirubrobacteraceae bacterium]|jgi:thiamine biosynthesis lipoprotein
MTAPTLIEARDTFACFGSHCTVIVADANADEAAHAVALARRRLLEWHHQFSRFEPDSELSRLNADPRPTVPVSAMMRRIVAQAIAAARATGGLVDPTLAGEIERAGYATHFERSGLELERALALAPPRAPARPREPAGWRDVSSDRRAGSVTRPPSLGLDLGGIAKGVFADELAGSLQPFAAFVVDCAGDLRLGGSASASREVHVANPFEGDALHTFELAAGGVATSGIGKRSWLDAGGRPAHHLLDPATGRPAFTGVVQATALAPTAAQAEALSKAAILSGPAAGAELLAAGGGGVLVLDDGSHRVL